MQQVAQIQQLKSMEKAYMARFEDLIALVLEQFQNAIDAYYANDKAKFDLSIIILVTHMQSTQTQFFDLKRYRIQNSDHIKSFLAKKVKTMQIRASELPEELAKPLRYYIDSFVRILKGERVTFKLPYEEWKTEIKPEAMNDVVGFYANATLKASYGKKMAVQNPASTVGSLRVTQEKDFVPGRLTGQYFPRTDFVDRPYNQDAKLPNSSQQMDELHNSLEGSLNVMLSETTLSEDFCMALGDCCKCVDKLDELGARVNDNLKMWNATNLAYMLELGKKATVEVQQRLKKVLNYLNPDSLK